MPRNEPTAVFDRSCPVEDPFVRAATLADVEQIIAAYQWLFDPPSSTPPQWDPGRAAAALGRAISSDAAAVLIAAVDGQVVGLCTAYNDIESVRFGRRVWVEDLAVHPDWRSRRIGKQLLDEAKRWARERGATHLELDSSEARVDAHRFYDRERPDSRSVCFGWQL
jgi:GNAT superfamily N-acetyltransferase